MVAVPTVAPAVSERDWPVFVEYVRVDAPAVIGPLVMMPIVTLPEGAALMAAIDEEDTWFVNKLVGALFKVRAVLASTLIVSTDESLKLIVALVPLVTTALIVPTPTVAPARIVIDIGPPFVVLKLNVAG